MKHILRPFAALLLLGSAVPALAAVSTAVDPAGIAAAKTILKESVGFDTVKGRGKVPAYAEYLKQVFIKGGFSASDITITPVGETANFHLVWKGSGKGDPIAIAAHMDVVEADPKDWTRDPFVAVEENGYVFGRGVLDNKFDLSMVTEALIALKARGFKPGRDIHVFFSGDEETDGVTAALQAKEAKAAGVAFLLNTDAGGGGLDKDGKPIAYTISASEKTYADYQVTVTDPGGHSSRPTATNAIAILAAATDRINAYKFPAQIDDVTRASLKAFGALGSDASSKAMLAFAANPKDEAAIATLRADPGSAGQIGTTCVPTMVTGGHAPNALPQKAVLTVNCRIFPGVSIESVRAELERVVADPRAKVTTGQEWTSTPASPLRPDVMAAVSKAATSTRPGVSVVPVMESGATDGVYYRALGIPAYGVGGIFIKDEDVLAHGLNERVPVAAIGPSLQHWQVLITELAK
jgi:acetylornithine deacetylase/succinyl-diaminopimelate desuccinylase-like protein